MSMICVAMLINHVIHVMQVNIADTHAGEAVAYILF